MYNTITQTYTITDIKKTFEGFEADLRMIARRTNKWSMSYVDEVFHDIIKLAEKKYLSSISIALQDTNYKIIKAAKYTVNETGSSISGDRAGGNDWTDIPNTTLTVILSYSTSWKSLLPEVKNKFGIDNDFKIKWVNSSIDTDFIHLKRISAKMYASNGYELRKENYN